MDFTKALGSDSSSAETPGGPLTLLYVDGHETRRSAVASNLESYNERFQVHTAAGEASALEYAPEECDCLITEYSLSDSNGIEFLESIRERWSVLPRIMFTANGSEAVASQAISAGVTEYVRNDGDDAALERLAGTIVDAIHATPSGEHFTTESAIKDRAIDDAPVGITISDARADDDPIIYANDRFAELTGYETEEIHGESWRFLHGDKTAATAISELSTAIDAAETVTVELLNYRKDGSTFWNQVSLSPVQPENDETRQYVCFHRDITERKEFEQKLREEQAFIEQSLDALDDVFYVFSASGEILRWNKRLEEVTGYSPEEIEGMTPMDFVVDEHTTLVAEKFEEVLSTGRAKLEADYVTKDGQRIPHEFTGIRLTGPNGDVIGFAGIGRDITERLEHERQLEQQNEQLEQFASVISHDLRNPINVARGHLELAMDTVQNDNLENIGGALERMEGIIDDVLTLAKEGDAIGETEQREIGELAETAWKHVATRDGKLVVENDDQLAADPDRLLQLLENLFRNAREHGGVDVTVTVGIENKILYVEDDGPGIPAEKRTEVFESGNTTTKGGTGLGLAIVSHIADAHGWDISLTDGRYGGARFEFNLDPTEAQPEGESEPEEALTVEESGIAESSGSTQGVEDTEQTASE